MAVPAPQHTWAACLNGKSNYIVSLRAKASTENKTLMSQFPYFTLETQLCVLWKTASDLVLIVKSALAELESAFSQYYDL